MERGDAKETPHIQRQAAPFVVAPDGAYAVRWMQQLTNTI